MTRRPILLIVNPNAGSKPGSGPPLSDDPERLRPEALASALRETGLEVELHVLADSDDAGALARKAADAGRDIVIGGGDGTVAPVASALLEHPEATLGILAMGSFNNIARGYGIPHALDAELEVIADGHAAAVDCGQVVGEDGGTPFFEAVGVGVDALGFLAVEIAERRGWLRALRALWRGFRLRRTPMRVTIDGRAYRTGSPAVTVSNGPYHGLGFAISPDADPTDGQLDVVVFRGMSRLEVLRHFLAVARRRPRRDPRIVESRARRVTIEGTRRLAAGPRRRREHRDHAGHPRGAPRQRCGSSDLEVERRPEEPIVGGEGEPVGHAGHVVGRLLLGRGEIAPERWWDLVGVLEVPLHEVADDRNRLLLLTELVRGVVDAFEHEVAQLVHDLQGRGVHPQRAGPQALVDHRPDHRADPLSPRLAEALDDARRKVIRFEHASSQRVERVVGEVGDPIRESDAERLRRRRRRLDLPGVRSDPVAHLPGEVRVLEHLPDPDALRGVVPAVRREER